MPLRASVQRWCGARVEAAEALRSFLVSKGAELDAQTLGPGIGTHGLGIFARRPIAKGEVLAAAAQFVDGGAYFWEWTKPIGLGTRRSKKGLGEKGVKREAFTLPRLFTGVPLGHRTVVNRTLRFSSFSS
ncbi:unnamed protein product [Durusdinium trenchii]|uniref:Uncharacterized protein n=1 Tax=Durusdinium trenchii TaxID=1381693 RepID=A0ABP0NCT0_9DINO